MFILSIVLAATLATKADVPRVSVAELHAMMQKGEAVAVDVRGSVPYELGHIATATWMPLGLMNQRAGELPQDKLLVMYCTCKAEETSLEAAMVLANQHGLKRVAVLQGGYTAWITAGLPVEAIQEVELPHADESSKSSASAGRLRPPAAVSCDRNHLTSYAGKVTQYRRRKDKTVLVMDTSADTTETVTIRHSGTDDPSRFYLIDGTPFTPSDWSRVEQRKGVLRQDMSAVAWVCRNGVTIIDWRPGVTFNGAE
jgi:rhodanese-related sulfurtransferase